MTLVRIAYNMGMVFIRIQGSKNSKRQGFVGLSFDDGPNAKNILQILKILKDNDAHATFFWIVEHVNNLITKDPNLFRKIIQSIKKDGHEIGLHAPYDYKPTILTRFFGKFSKSELSAAKSNLEGVTNMPIRLYRPHYLFQPMTLIFAKQLGLTPVLGSIFHYAKADSSIKIQVENFTKVSAGDILIFHDGITLLRKSTYITDLLPQVLINLKEKGLRAANISDLLEVK